MTAITKDARLLVEVDAYVHRWPEEHAGSSAEDTNVNTGTT